jgi:hypothetical protein
MRRELGLENTTYEKYRGYSSSSEEQTTFTNTKLTPERSARAPNARKLLKNSRNTSRSRFKRSESNFSTATFLLVD